MQISAGRFRGLKLLSPEGRSSRPTLSRIRQALFNILTHYVAGSVFLDLYAGAGSVGLEAYSQGCRQVVLVESDPAVVRNLRQNVLRLDPEQTNLEVLAQEASAAVRDLANRQRKFDLVFLDPPYNPESLAAWSSPGNLARLLTPAGWLIVQHAKRDLMPEVWAGCRKVKDRDYGETCLSFFQLEAVKL
ncbi:MAG: 16S rRNA (guanine(966)-N(2))-methyltransferase RsmD [Candidatus Firestonebacteria bacterium]|nr:16S rRNA (guanine(966)-N(2))-methyltransferase RsmD [Candidatus Firestonebacteria bacterium]